MRFHANSCLPDQFINNDHASARTTMRCREVIGAHPCKEPEVDVLAAISSAFTSRPTRAAISTAASTSAWVVWKLTMHALSTKRPLTTAFETKASPPGCRRSRTSRLRASRYRSTAGSPRFGRRLRGTQRKVVMLSSCVIELQLVVTPNGVGHGARQLDVLGDHRPIPRGAHVTHREPHLERAEAARVLRAVIE